jgi:hypothetical protein
MNSILMDYKTPEGRRTCLVFMVGRRWAWIVTMDTYPLRVRKVRLKELDYMSVMPYSIKKAVNIYRGRARSDYGGRKGWPKRLKEALS